MEIRAQAARLDEFASTLAGVLSLFEIYDFEFSRQVEGILGLKLRALHDYYRAFELMDDEHLTVREWFDEPPLRWTFLTASIDEYIAAGTVKERKYDLRNSSDLETLVEQADQNIGAMERTLRLLGDFIKANCDINDLFPKSPPSSWFS